MNQPYRQPAGEGGAAPEWTWGKLSTEAIGECGPLHASVTSWTNDRYLWRVSGAPNGDDASGRCGSMEECIARVQTVAGLLWPEVVGGA